MDTSETFFGSSTLGGSCPQRRELFFGVAGRHHYQRRLWGPRHKDMCKAGAPARGRTAARARSRGCAFEHQGVRARGHIVRVLGHARRCACARSAGVRPNQTCVSRKTCNFVDVQIPRAVSSCGVVWCGVMLVYSTQFTRRGKGRSGRWCVKTAQRRPRLTPEAIPAMRRAREPQAQKGPEAHWQFAADRCRCRRWLLKPHKLEARCAPRRAAPRKQRHVSRSAGRTLCSAGPRRGGSKRFARAGRPPRGDKGRSVTSKVDHRLKPPMARPRMAFFSRWDGTSRR
jgi:hypothetical protein